MKYSMKAIETRYAGVLFRSRLEAKWASMFDLLQWRWVYEPTDFSGWIPDFAIYGEKQVTYVEVKPVWEFPSDVADKIEASGIQDETMIVGEIGPFQRPKIDRFYDGESVIGWLSEIVKEQREGAELCSVMWWQPAMLGMWRGCEPQLGFCPAFGSFHDRISGKYDGGRHGSYANDFHAKATLLWREAGNRTRWTK